MEIIPHAVNGKSALETAVAAARQAGDSIKEHLADAKTIKKKGRNNLVSELDTNSESAIIKILKQSYPDFSIISEEQYSHNSASGFTWIIDPLDGTTNSIFGVPFISVNIGLVYNSTILLGVTYDPIRKEIFTSERAKGAYLNNKRVHVSKINMIEDALICADLGYKADRGGETLEIFKKLWGRALCLRILGSAALGLAYVACGRVSLYYHRSIYPWDETSGILLVREAGGEVMNFNRTTADFNSTEIIAANKKLLQSFNQFLNMQS